MISRRNLLASLAALPAALLTFKRGKPELAEPTWKSYDFGPISIPELVVPDVWKNDDRIIRTMSQLPRELQVDYDLTMEQLKEWGARPSPFADVFLKDGEA